MCNYSQIFIQSLGKYKNHAKWNGSDFGAIKLISNTHVGSVGQDFIENLCLELGLRCEFPEKSGGGRKNQSPWDICINGVKFELKTATEDTTGSFQFNHFRYHRPYDAVLCLGVSPNQLYFNLWTKEELTTGRAGNLVSMEAKANASYKLTKRPIELIPIESFYDSVICFLDNYSRTHGR